MKNSSGVVELSEGGTESEHFDGGEVVVIEAKSDDFGVDLFELFEGFAFVEKCERF